MLTTVLGMVSINGVKKIIELKKKKFVKEMKLENYFST